MSEGLTGHCLCEAINFSAGPPLSGVLHCHCENCRRLTGNFIAAVRVETRSIDIGDDSTLRWHELGYAKYGFCSACGATLFFVATDRPEVSSVTAGMLDDVSNLELESVWFADEAQSHNKLSDNVPHHRANG